MTRRRTRLLFLIPAALFLCSRADAELIHPEKSGDPLVYGVKGGIALALYPFGLDDRPQGGPRGLVRVGYEAEGKYYPGVALWVSPMYSSLVSGHQIGWKAGCSIRRTAPAARRTGDGWPN